MVDVLLKKIKQTDKRDEVYEGCIQLKKSVDETLDILHKLKKANELTNVSNYDQRKRSEERRLTGMSELLRELARRLAKERTKQKMDDIDKNTKSQAAATKQENTEDTVDVDDDEDEDEDDDGDDEDEEESDEEEDTANLFIAISDFEAQEEHDLSFKKSEILTILNEKPDGWWLGENAQGIQGLVPKTYLQVYKKYNQGTPNVADAVEDEEEEEEEEEEDDAEDAEDEEEESEPQNVKIKGSKAQSKKTQSQRIAVKKVVSELNATDVLMTMGAIPEGFRASTLAQLLAEGNEFHMSYYLQPTLTQSKLSFKDLHWDQVHGGVRPRKTHLTHMFTLWSCRMIPLPGPAVQVLSRHVRFCLFDGQRVLSNIHTIRATWQPKNPKTWTFSPRVTGILPSLLDGDCFVRSNSQSSGIGILFELGLTYIRNVTGHQGELSCGWAFLQLFTVNGDAVPHRTYEIVLNGGTPYEKGLEVDPTLSKRASLFQQMMVSRKQPKLLVKLQLPTTQMRTILNLLPDTLVGPKCYIQLLAFYRQLLADVLLKDRINMQSADLICNPVLATFPELLEQTDIFDALRSAWSEKEITLTRSVKRDQEFMKHSFVQVYHDSVYPLLRSITLPANKWADEEVEISRWKNIANFLQQSQERNGSLYGLLSPEHAYHAFDISEISYDFLGMTRKTVAVD
uniref:nephrocystin-1 isoform X2 n=1 Tax=Pristiophorus japonicus TaxID=55135 RepID=UPI00398EAE67